MAMTALRIGPGAIAVMIACGVASMLSPWRSAAAAETSMTPGSTRPVTADDAMLGRRLFLGRIPLAASLRGEASSLPAAASRCINCHSLPRPAMTAGGERAKGAPVQGLAPDLLAFASRRGGPAFSYDAGSMCRTLRTGIDPQQVWLARAMPQFLLTPQQCRALWAYLTQSAGS